VPGPNGFCYDEIIVFAELSMPSVLSANLAMILFTVTTNAVAQLLLKRGMTGIGDLSAAGGGIIGTAFTVLFNPYVFAGLCTFVISMASHLFVLSRVQLSYAYPFLSLAYVIVAVGSWYLFSEDIGLWRVLGIGLIILGTIFIAQS
jgi:multidrug transporter EmrE-like cation transporter